MTRYGNRTPTFDELKESTLKLNINYQELQYTLVKESQKTTWLDLLSNVGGTLGLFTGFSFLSLVEILEILFEIFLSKINSCFCIQSKPLNPFIKVSPRIQAFIFRVFLDALQNIRSLCDAFVTITGTEPPRLKNKSLNLSLQYFYRIYPISLTVPYSSVPSST